MKKALLLIDIQNDFLPGGTMGVEGGDAIIPKVNQLLTIPFDLVVATKDWHPPNHVSFAKTHDKEVGEIISCRGTEQKLWPEHCIQKSWGAEFPPTLDIDRIAHYLIRKGEDSEVDSYSGFFDNEKKKQTGLHALLQKMGIQEVFIVGLVTEICVLFTALDAKELGYETHVILDACKGLDARRGDVERAVEKMRQAGVQCDTIKKLSNLSS